MRSSQKFKEPQRNPLRIKRKLCRWSKQRHMKMNVSERLCMWLSTHRTLKSIGKAYKIFKDLDCHKPWLWQFINVDILQCLVLHPSPPPASIWSYSLLSFFNGIYWSIPIKFNPQWRSQLGSKILTPPICVILPIRCLTSTLNNCLLTWL